VNYNGEAYLNDCLVSVQSNCKTIAHEVILVDNFSSDHSVDLVKTNFPQIKIIQNKSNLGFAAANNIGVNESSGEYLLLLNNDTLLRNHLTPALQILELNTQIGAVGIKMLDKNRNYRQSAGYFPNPIRLLKLKSLLLHKEGFRDGRFNESPTYYEVDWVEASFLLIKKELWTQLQGMDESFFMYAEDIDFLKRLSLLKKKTVYLPQLSYIHYGGFQNGRNLLLKNSLSHYVELHFTGLSRILAHLSIEINYLIKKYVKKTV
jgi:GT2 family glycosyltransferase